MRLLVEAHDMMRLLVGALDLIMRLLVGALDLMRLLVGAHDMMTGRTFVHCQSKLHMFF
jgi:hypothetical protein